jgi:hypothetical protein
MIVLIDNDSSKRLHIYEPYDQTRLGLGLYN